MSIDAGPRMEYGVEKVLGPSVNVVQTPFSNAADVREYAVYTIVVDKLQSLRTFPKIIEWESGLTAFGPWSRHQDPKSSRHLH